MNSMSFSLSVVLAFLIVSCVGACRLSSLESLIFELAIFCHLFATGFGNCMIRQTLTVLRTFFRPLLYGSHRLNSSGKRLQNFLCSVLLFFFMSVSWSARSCLFLKSLKIQGSSLDLFVPYWQEILSVFQSSGFKWTCSNFLWIKTFCFLGFLTFWKLDRTVKLNFFYLDLQSQTFCLQTLGCC